MKLGQPPPESILRDKQLSCFFWECSDTILKAAPFVSFSPVGSPHGRHSLRNYTDYPPTPHPPGLNEVDTGRVREALESSRSPATRRVYACQWRMFSAWAEGRDLPTLPADPSTVAAYLTERAGSGVSIATVQLARAAIAAEHVDASLEDPCAHPGVRRTRAGLSRMFGRPPLQTPPLTSDVAAAIRATARRPWPFPSGRMESESTAGAAGSSISPLYRRDHAGCSAATLRGFSPGVE